MFGTCLVFAMCGFLSSFAIILIRFYFSCPPDAM